MARKPNYGFEKRKKELDREARKHAKREDRRRRKEGTTEDVGTAKPPAEGEKHGDSGVDIPGA